MEIEEAMRRIYLGRSIAFMGAGFSAGIEAIKGNIPYGFEFAKELSDALGEPDALPLDLASSEYANSGLEPTLPKLLKERFTARSAVEDHTLISCLPWRRIYTTNYDNVIELAALIRDDVVLGEDQSLAAAGV